jgi:hypothetical protein
MTTIRDMLRRLQLRAKDADLPPHEMADMLVQLTSLYSSITDEVRESEFAYKAVLLGLLDSEEAANRAKIRAENTEAYRRMRTARDCEKVTLELIRSLKVSLRTRTEDLRMSGLH